jgi:hypothetical protein
MIIKPRHLLFIIIVFVISITTYYYIDSDAKSDAPQITEPHVNPDGSIGPDIPLKYDWYFRPDISLDTEHTCEGPLGRLACEWLGRERRYNVMIRETNVSRTAGVSRTANECVDLGIINKNKCHDYERIVDNLRRVPLAYNRSDKMTFGKPTEIRLLIDASNTNRLLSALEGLEGSIVEDTTIATLHMSAELHGVTFRVEPHGLQRKVVTPVNPTPWTWSVTPLEAGDDKVITLDLYAHIQDGDSVLEPFSVRTYRDRISVDVTTWDYVVSMVKDLTPMHAFVVALFGTLSGIAAWGWRQSSTKTKSATRTGTRRKRATRADSKTPGSGSVGK